MTRRTLSTSSSRGVDEMKKAKELLFAIAFVLVAALLLMVCGTALRPEHTTYGATWKPFLAEPDNSLDYLYLGSSYAYCDVSPGWIYDASGLTGYVMAGPEQTFSLSRWYLRQALGTQSPDLVFIEATGLGFERYQNYTQVNVDYMPLTLNRLQATLHSAEPELRTGLLFPLYFYHDRWKEFSLTEAVDNLSPGTTDLLKGYTAVNGLAEGIESGPFTRELPENTYQDNLADLGDVLTVCHEAGAQPVVVFHPTYSQYSQEDRDRIRADVTALDPDALFFDWSNAFEDIGLDPTRHFYDAGHFNQEGAAIFSAWLGRFAVDELGAVPRTQTAENAAAWQATAEYWKEQTQGS